MTDYLLDYIHNVLFRQTVQGSLCRGETYHQLRRQIAIINGRHFRGSSEMEIAVWNECVRLLTNAIIYYNAVLLTNLLEHYKLSGEKEKCDLINKDAVAGSVGSYQFLRPIFVHGE